MSTPSNVHVSSHPLITHKLTLLRNQTTKCDEFRRILREITFYLGYEVRKERERVCVSVRVRERGDLGRRRERERDFFLFLS